MAITVEQFVAELGWDIDSSEFKEFQSQIDQAGKELKRVTQFVVGATAAITGLAVVTNEATAQQVRLAESVGASAETVEALSHSLGGLGFDSERVVDLIEEMNNKFGELKGLGEMSSASDALKILNLQFKELRDLAPEEQFISIMDAAKNLADQQEAVSAVDMLMGGEANKVLGFLRSQEGSLSDLVTQYKALTLLTEEGRKGAVRFSDQWQALTLVGKSFTQEFSGEFGAAIAPLVEEIVDLSVDNKELIQSNIKEWAEDLADAIEDVVGYLRVVNGYVQEFGGYEVVIKRIALAFAAWRLGGIVTKLTTLLGSTKGLGAAVSALKIPQAFTGGLVVLIALLAQDIWTSINGGESAFSGVSMKVTDAMGKVDEFVASLLGIPVDEFRAGMLDTFDAIGNGYDTADKAVTEFGNAVISTYSDMDKAVTEFGNLVWSTLENAEDKAIAGLKSFGLEVLSWLSDLGQDIANMVGGFLGESITSKLNAAANTLRGAFGFEPYGGAANTLRGAFGFEPYGGAAGGRLAAPPGPSNVANSNVVNDNRQYTLAPSATVNGQPAGSSGGSRDLVNQLENMLGQSVATLGG